jgi:hypothetical protein
MPKEPTWWVWLVTALLLAAGLTGLDHDFTIAILLSLAQTGWFLFKLPLRNGVSGAISAA